MNIPRITVNLQTESISVTRMKLIIMTKPTFFVEEDKILTTLFEEGMDCLHLNKPNSEPIYSERLLSLLPEEYYSNIVVHDHFYLKQEYKLGGIHIDGTTTEVPNNYKGNISRTIHTVNELKEAKKMSKYVFLGNIFDSISEPYTKSAMSVEELKQASKLGLIDKHVFAVGGMTLDNVHIAKDLGFGGVVIRGDLWNHFDIHSQQDYRDIIQHFTKLRKTID